MEGGNFKASLGYIVRPCLFKKEREGGKKGGRKEREGEGIGGVSREVIIRGKLGIRKSINFELWVTAQHPYQMPACVLCM